MEYISRLSSGEPLVELLKRDILASVLNLTIR